MDDSCQDFEDVCSKLLKRVPKKHGEPRQQRKEEKQPSSQASDGAKRNHKKHGDSGSRGGAAEADREVIGGAPGFKSEDAGKAGREFTAKDKVLQRMQKFKRVSPQKIVHWDNILALDDHAPSSTLMKQNDSPPEAFGADSPPPEETDEALAMQLQQELDREATQTQTVDLMDGGLFFCHICHKDLTHMTPEGRTQHVNRCLDEGEGSASAPRPLPLSSGVPDCPICGKKFKSLKSHSAHLKRCSSDMGVSPAVLLQALHRQAEERQNGLSANMHTETGGPKRKGSSRPAKKPRKKAEVLDEKTMVALALSSSLYEQERLSERAVQTDTDSNVSMAPMLKWTSGTGKGRGKKKKGAIARPPPLLLVQDAAAALKRLQERVSALLLRSRPPSPPTPTRCPSALPGWNGAAPLWQKSSLLEGHATHQSDFYTHELRGFFVLSEAATNDRVPPSIIKSVSSDCPAKEVSVVTTKSSVLPPSQTAGAIATEELPVSTQVFRDLMELAEDGMVLSQGSHSASCSGGDDLNTSLLPSGFVQEELEDQADLCTRGFLPKIMCTNSPDNQTGRPTVQLSTETKSTSDTSMAFSDLRSDLGSMVNNPQLSDVQLQVDSGQVYFAHSFMLYARCPLLVEMVHENGFGVQEEGMPAAQRILISDVPGQAVFAVLQYLYTAHFTIPSSLRLHVLELASRFDLKQLKQLCELTQKEAANRGHEEDSMSWENADSQKGRAFLDLLRSMWNEEDEDNEAVDADERQDKEKAAAAEDSEDNELTAGDGEVGEEKVTEKELEEIYEFAATQRQRNEEAGSMHDREDQEDGEKEFTKLVEPKTSTCHHSKSTNADPVFGSDPSLFSQSLGDCGEGDLLSCSARIPQTTEAEFCHKVSAKRSATGRTLLQSSASIVDDISLGGPPVHSVLPVPGETPEQQRNCDPEEGFIVKHGRQGPRRSSGNLSPDRLQEKREPELIVLSDSNSPSPNSPVSPENPEKYTQITAHHMELKNPGSVERSPDCPAAMADQSPLDCSAELSWLIPSTPLQPGKDTSGGSTRTRSSIFRMQLFPKSDASAPVFSSPENHICVSGRVTRAFTRIEGDPEVNPEGMVPHSSTPLPSEIHKPQVRLCSPRSNSSIDKQRLKRQGAKRKPSERRRPDPSQSPSSCLHKGVWNSQSDCPSQRSADRCKPVSPESNVTRNGTMDEEEERENKAALNETPQEEAASSGFHHSFMDLDEPPMAFNDSWGLDMCADGDAGGFNLRLEDSGARSQQERGPQHQDAAQPACRSQPPPPSPGLPSFPSQAHGSQPSHSTQAQTDPSPQGRPPPQLSTSLLDSKVWDAWEEEDEDFLPVSQRGHPSAQLETPAASCQKRRRTVAPITPTPRYSDMDTPELKNKLNRFGVRPLPKRQMILKLKEIHQYTHQLLSSDSEDEARPVSHAAQLKPSSLSNGNRQHSCTQPPKFKAPVIPPSTSPVKHSSEEQIELLSASQGSNTSSTAASEESERSNPELVPSSDGDSDSDNGISASQATSRLQDRLQAVRAFILSNSQLYTQILEYRPLVLSQFQGQLKAAGIRLGTSRLAEYLDSQCITFTTAKAGQPAGRHRWGKRTGRRLATAGERGPSRKGGVPATS